MNLYLVKRKDDWSWDEWDAAIVRAESETNAASVHPGGEDYDSLYMRDVWEYWRPDNLQIELIASDVDGDPGLVLASFKAG